MRPPSEGHVKNLTQKNKIARTSSVFLCIWIARLNIVQVGLPTCLYDLAVVYDALHVLLLVSTTPQVQVPCTSSLLQQSFVVFGLRQGRVTSVKWCGNPVESWEWAKRRHLAVDKYSSSVFTSRPATTSDDTKKTFCPLTEAIRHLVFFGDSSLSGECQLLSSWANTCLLDDRNKPIVQLFFPK